ncbi:PREDICTED: uncharacterized protein LOC108555403 [Eufriesea mexicana]|uniref:uncharacterized protein LOC108555403 n=1 Tax=Eufriesea mexicana TaxID=516756 RepID=UPI00083BF629|nr:PREDICTED: uncharacterized protein LOC108555403 [Eufriesea mexicana]
MTRMQSCSDTYRLFLILLILGTVIVHGESEPMARPVRSETSAISEDLKKFLDNCYYLYSGRAEVTMYGKRGNALSSVPSIDYVWDTIKTSPEDIRRSQQQKFEERMQDERRFLGELEGYGARKDNPRIYISPSQAMVHRYYDDVQ